MVSAAESPIHRTPIDPVQKAFFPGLKGETPADFLPARNDPVNHHVGTKVHVLVSVNVRRGPTVQAKKFVSLGLVNETEGFAQERMVKDQRIFVPLEETTDSLLVFRQSRGTIATRKTLREIDMESDIHARVIGQYCRSF
jgi:hypothetical protein